MSIDTQTYKLRMVVDADSLVVMKLIGTRMGVTIDISAKAGERYSSHGGEGTLMVPEGYCHISINPGTAKINDFWDKVSHEKTRLRKIWEAANPVVVNNR